MSYEEMHPHVEIRMLKIVQSVKQLKNTKVVYYSDKLEDKHIHRIYS